MSSLSFTCDVIQSSLKSIYRVELANPDTEFETESPLK